MADFGSRATRIRLFSDRVITRSRLRKRAESPDPSGAMSGLADNAAADPLGESVLENLPVGIVLTASTGRVEFANAEARRLTEQGIDTAIAARAVRDAMAWASAHRRAKRVEVEAGGPEERAVVVEVSPRPGGGAMGVLTDVTGLRQLESIRRDFVANASHELRTPIGAIGVLADAVAGAPDTDDVARLARRIRSESDRLAVLVTDLLDLSRIESVGNHSTESAVDLTEVLEESVQRSHAAAEAAQVPIRTSFEAGATVVLGDESQLVSAVTNLLENAIKYSDPGAAVNLTLRDSVAASPAVRGPCLEVVVEDHGIGIPTRELDRVFERFYRVDRARQRQSGGTGLGLAIVGHVVANHNGEITVSSREGEGSTFTIRLPVLGPDLDAFEAG